MKDETIEVACFFGYETDAAVQITDPASGEVMWIPFSQVESMHKATDGSGTIVMTRWIAGKKGLL